MRIRSSQRQRTTLRRVFLLTSTVIFLLTIGLIILINLGDTRKAFAAASGDFQSKGSGNWNSASTWQKFGGGGAGSWSNAPASPTSADGVITILSGHTVTVTANVTADQIVINSGGFLIINSGVTLTLANGSATDLNVTGTIKNAGTITISAGAAIVFNNGGKYQHNYTTTGGTIPTATWSTGSTCEVIGYTNNNAAPAGLQAFYNFTWNCPGQSQDISLGSALTTINGDFTVTNTGASNLLRLGTAASTLAIAGNFIMSGGTFSLTKSNSASSMTVAGDYLQSGGSFLAIDGNNTATINLSGNMSHTGGTITHSGNASSNVIYIFKKSGTQTYTASGNTVTGSIDYQVNSGAILNVGTSILLGRNFTVSAGGGLGIGSLTGVTSSSASGNIQVSGSRSLATTADYTFSGASAQVTGDGLPGTVRNLSISNSSNVTLTNSVTLTGTLTFVNGKIITGANEVNVTNTSTSSITGYSTSDYIVGNLRRSISGSGSYDFPIGITGNYELVNLNFSSIVGPTNILATFTNSDPIVAALPLTGLIVNNLTIDKMITYGYWSITPNLPVISGTYNLSATEIVSNLTVNSGCSYSLLNRLTNLLSWSSQGTQAANTQTVNGNSITAVRSGLNVFGDFSIGYGELLSFSSPTLTSGVAGQVNAVYVFPDACSNVDAWVQIMSLDGGATLNNIDAYTVGNGYMEGWQPYINVPANATSSILWKITFKVKDTSTDTILPWLAISGIDIDAGSGILEFVEASYPYSYGLPPASPLTITNNNGTYRATANASLGAIANIDTSKTNAMFQINYKNVNNFFYRTGVISTSNVAQTRQTSLYFKSFFSNNLALPIRLINFEAKIKSQKVNLKWATASETNNSFFTIERSSDGENFERVSQQRGAGNSSTTLFYNTTDEFPLSGISYYRLKQTDYDGHSTYSNIETIMNENKEEAVSIEIKSISPNPFSESLEINFTSKFNGPVNILITSSTGQTIVNEVINVNDGFNNYRFRDLSQLTSGMYFVSIIYQDQKITQKVIKR